MILEQRPTRNTSVLVVDDDSDTCENLKDILEEFNYDVHVTIDPAQAIAWTKERGFDLTILDLKMPNMSGLELFDELLLVRGDTNAVIATAFAETETVRLALGHGVAEVWHKPIDVEELLKAIRHVADCKSA